MDTFFTYYFTILGVLLILSIIYKIIKYLLGQDKSDWQYELASDVLNWCLDLYPIRKQKPLLTLVEGKSHLSGEYNFYKNTIIIYRDNNVIRRDLIRTVIHEFFHFYNLTSQAKNNLYFSQLKHFGYENHPQEILCNTMGETLAKLYLNKN